MESYKQDNTQSFSGCNMLVKTHFLPCPPAHPCRQPTHPRRKHHLGPAPAPADSATTWLTVVYSYAARDAGTRGGRDAVTQRDRTQEQGAEGVRGERGGGSEWGCADLLALDEGLAVLVELELGDLDLGGVDGNGNLGAVGLLLDDAVHVDAVAAAVHSGHLGYSLLSVLPPNDLHLVVLADRKRAHLRRGRSTQPPSATSTASLICSHPPADPPPGLLCSPACICASSNGVTLEPHQRSMWRPDPPLSPMHRVLHTS